MCQQESMIWEKLLRPYGKQPPRSLLWQRDIAIHTPPYDPRVVPTQFLAMTGDLHTLPDHNPTLNINDLRKLPDGRYLATEGEITGVNGLLRLLKLFPRIGKPPETILLVGAINPNSLLSVLKYCQQRRWNSDVTLVDSSPIPIRVVKEMVRHGFIDWPDLSCVRSDIVDYVPSHAFDLVIGDMLSPWMNDKLGPDVSSYWPSKKFEDYLNWVASNLTRQGHFLSRVLLPLDTASGANDPNRRFPFDSSQIAERVLNQIGPGLRGAVSKDSIRSDLGEEGSLFDSHKPIEGPFCGIYKMTPKSPKPSANQLRHANLRYTELHKKLFPWIHEIVVDDPRSGFRYKSYLCGH